MDVEIGVISQKDFVIESIVEWSIKDFLSLPAEVADSYDSPAFSFANESWFLRIYPNGSIWNGSEGFIDLYLCRDSSGPPIEVEITFGVKTVDGKIDYEIHYTKKFEGTFSFWFFSKLIHRSEFINRKSDLLPSGTLTLVCRMKRKGINEVASSSSTVPVKCTYCNKAFAAQEDIQCHLKKCEELLIHCQNCSSGVTIKNWHDHKCQKTDREGSSKTVTTKCSYCNKTLDAEEDIQLHLQECEHLPIKCRKCNDGVTLKNWYEHKCQMTDAEDFRFSNYPHENKVLQDYKQLFLNQKECDAIIRVKDKEFSAHKAILAARSSVFESTFRSDMKEKESGIVDVEDCDPSSFSDFLCFLYCGEVETLSEDNVFSLFTTADKYDVQDLKDICVKFMKENISINTYCDTITLALLHCESELVTLATDFFTKNVRKIAKTAAWQRFSADNPTQSNELFIKALDAAAGSNE